MIITVIDKGHFIKIDTDNMQEAFKLDSPIFKLCERLFWEFIETSNPADELEDKYFSDDAIYTKKGAIRGAIELIEEIAQEENKTTFITQQLLSYDLETAFS